MRDDEHDGLAGWDGDEDDDGDGNSQHVPRTTHRVHLPRRV